MTPQNRFWFRNPTSSTRRQVLKNLLAAPAALTERDGTAIVMRMTDRKVLHAENLEFAAGALLPPASSIKPFAFWALVDGRKVQASDAYVCSGKLRVGTHELNCIHPVMALPMDTERAIAYSCNGAVAHFAERFAVDELASALVRIGFTSPTGLAKEEAAGRVHRNTTGDACKLQALGEEGVWVTPLEMLVAYARLARRLQERRFAAVLGGLEGAVRYGTAQAAAVPGATVAGKTGSIVLHSGSAGAWFTGFAPSRAPRVAVTVFRAGHSGGADAAPIAADLLRIYLKRT